MDHTLGIVRIAHQHKTSLKTVCKPLGEEGWDIGALASIDDHSSFLTEQSKKSRVENYNKMLIGGHFYIYKMLTDGHFV